MNFDIQSLFPDLEALTPDGRWNALQDWLSKNPEYGERIEEWSQQTPDEVILQIRNLASQKYGPLGAVVIMAMEAKLRRAIELLQACYRERQAYDNQQLEKETKNVRTRRPTKRRSKANHR